MFHKTNPYLSKTAQSPQVVGAAGKTAFFFGTFFWASKRKYRCQANVTSPGGNDALKIQVRSLAMFCHFFASKKVTKKDMAVEKSNHFEASSAAQKNSPHDWFGPAAPKIREAQTVFCLTRLGRPQNGDFSKAICHAAWYLFLLK
jgi:hypothetical protein